MRVPTFTGHALACERPSSIAPSAPNGPPRSWPPRPAWLLSHLPTPLRATGGNDTLVGRIRRDPTVPHGLALFLVGDNLRKGAALNAVQIAEELLAELN